MIINEKNVSYIVAIKYYLEHFVGNKKNIANQKNMMNYGKTS